LQVEHPVTEMITGQDLVEWQLKVASGQPLPLKQSELTITGHSIEARVYAEDPDKGFLPATGTLRHLVPPAESRYVRVDTGVEQGDTISPFYDPMIAKLIVWGETREAALKQMDAALAAYQVVGVTTNLPFLRRIVTHHSFASGDVDTGLIARHQDALLAPAAALGIKQLALLALAEALATQPQDSHAWTVLSGWRLNGTLERRFSFSVDTASHDVLLRYQNNGFVLTVDGASINASATLSGNTLHANLDGVQTTATVVRDGVKRVLFHLGHRFEVSWVDPYAYEEAGVHGDTHLKAPMPGRVVALVAPVGEKVEKGAPLLILEAMKMEHTLNAPNDGVVKAFYFAAGDQVSEGDELVDFEAE
jgi:3-methylcrotonyl-CoA carboxylase alpha subunit